MKLTKIVSNEGNSFAPVRKEWIATAIGAAASLASSLIGGHKAAQAAREAEKKQKAREASENAWYLRRYNEDYADTAAGQNLMRKAKDFANSQWKKAEGAKAVGGGTDASAAMAKEAGNKMVGDTLANISAQDQSKKAQVDAMHRNAEDRFMQMDVNRELQRSQNITNAAQNASNAMMQAGAAIDGAKSQANTSTTSLTGGSNGSADVKSGVSPSSTGAIYNGSGVKIYDPDAEWVDV